VVRSSFSICFIRFWPLHFMVTPSAFSSFPDTCRYFPSNFRASFVGIRARGLDIDLPCSSFIISSTPFRRLLLPEADTHLAFQLFAVYAQGKLPSYNVKHTPVLFDPIYVQSLPLLLPPRSNSFVRISCLTPSFRYRMAKSNQTRNPVLYLRFPSQLRTSFLSLSSPFS